MTTAPDIILHGGAITTLDRSNPAPEAVAVTAGRFSAVGDAAGIMAAAGPGTRVIDLVSRHIGFDCLILSGMEAGELVAFDENDDGARHAGFA